MSETTAILAYGEGLERVAQQHPDLKFVPGGDARLSRLCRECGDDVVLVQQFPEPHRFGRRRHWAPKRIGMLVTPAALERARVKIEQQERSAQLAKVQAKGPDANEIETYNGASALTTQRGSWSETYLGVLDGIAEAIDDEYRSEVIEEPDEGGPMEELRESDHDDLELEARLRTNPGAQPRTPDEIEGITREYYRQQMDGLGL